MRASLLPFLLSLIFCNQAVAEKTSAPTLTLEEQKVRAVVDQQLNAYNAQDIEAFAATYHSNVEIYSATQGLLYTGKATLIEKYGKKFADLKCLNATSMLRMQSGAYLVDHEKAESCSQQVGKIDRSIEVIVNYEVRDGLIVKVLFLK